LLNQGHVVQKKKQKKKTRNNIIDHYDCVKVSNLIFLWHGKIS